MSFVSRLMKIATFLRKNGYLPKRVVDFPLERDTFRNKIMNIVEDFREKTYNNGKPWKSSRILRVNPFFHFSFFVHHFYHFFSFFFSFFHFFLFFFIFFIFPFFLVFFIFSFSFIFLHFPSFSFIFLHFSSFSDIF